MAFSAVLSQMLVLTFIILIGFIARKLDIMTDSFDGTLSRLVLDITLPCMVLGSVLTATEAPSTQVITDILTYSFAVYALIIALSLIIPRLLFSPKDERGAYSFMITFSNVGFMGFPVLTTIFGPPAVLYGAIFNIPFNILIFTVGVLMVAREGGSLKKRLLSNMKKLISPTVVACVIAMVLALCGVHDMGTIGKAFESMGALTTPAALLIIGSSLAKYSPRDMLSNWRSYAIAAIRLLAVPAIVLFAFRPFVSDPLTLGVMVVLCGMPVATNGLMLCLRYNGNLKVMTQGVFLSTVASIITIPCLSLLLQLV